MCEVISSGEFDAFQKTHQSFVLLDVRDEEECHSGDIPGSVCVPTWLIPFRVHNLIPDKNMTVVVYCSNGERSYVAAVTLEAYGYTHVVDMEDGYERYCERFVCSHT